MSVLMSYSQFSYLNLHLHGLIYDHSVLPWQSLTAWTRISNTALTLSSCVPPLLKW